MGNSGPPFGTGEPVTPTITFDGRYDFRRAGSIMVTPGSNRFGGTMQFFYGPNQRYYQRNTILSVFTSTSLGGGPPALSTYHESQFGEFVVGRTLNGYRLTTFGIRLIVSTINYYTCTNITSANCEYYQSKIQHLSTIVPFTTGMISGYQPGGPGGTTTVHTITGYDNRTAAGLNGVVSLVRARLVHPYRVPPSGFIGKFTSTLSASKIDFHFLPEPGSFAMMAAGVVALAGLYRRRRHCVER